MSDKACVFTVLRPVAVDGSARLWLNSAASIPFFLEKFIKRTLQSVSQHAGVVSQDVVQELGGRDLRGGSGRSLLMRPRWAA